MSPILQSKFNSPVPFVLTTDTVFFAAHRIGLALVIILMLLGSIFALIAVGSPRDRLVAWLFVPYGVWVAFASLLNASIFALN